MHICTTFFVIKINRYSIRNDRQLILCKPKKKKRKKKHRVFVLLHFLILYIVRHITYKFSFCNSLNQSVKLFTVFNSFFDNKYKEEQNMI